MGPGVRRDDGAGGKHRDPGLPPKLFPACALERLGEGMMTHSPYHAFPETSPTAGGRK
ncbi:hypothetical protein C8J26_3306 [Sphingomonas aurantiaca]|uniref:Uncharacterized protein n=1 Tax=Sphingomonas aurantiaca TaxID=185949 RepID=A0A2T5GI40_9SPHN|nr:hypothetical protein C8J26_3306 [Sphingomonas aurantiaca]